MAYGYALQLKRQEKVGMAQGIGLTLLLAVAAKWLANIPFLNIMGQLVLAILLGIVWRAAVGVPVRATAGVSFSSKRLLRLGIILLGMRLNLTDIVHAGPKVLAIAVIHIVVTIAAVCVFAKLLRVERRLGLLTACGTAICGAAAVVAISPQIKATDEETAISAASVAILGTLFTLAYTLLYPVLGLSAEGYGIFAGATLHEVAHVIAASAPGGQQAMDLAVIVKLTRVALLVPVAIILGIWADRLRRRESGEAAQATHSPIPIPWFIVGFLAMSGVNTLGIIPAALTDYAITAAYLLIAMAMAGLGLSVDLAAFRRMGMRAFAAGLLGSMVLTALGYGLVHAFGLM